ncbi:hypothetical protein [Actinoallomurus sp. CA-150999]|uniref:hypothetical protein n=1 Tax=Actinoallomurus sp. CA-150999 TaxID=3239887 RepID=UPI003D8FFE2D
MPRILSVLLAAPFVGAAMVLSGCAASTQQTKASAAVAAAPGGPGGSGGGPGSSSPKYTPTGAYTLTGGNASKTDTRLSAGKVDQSAVLVSKSGSLTLTDPAIRKTGNTKSTDESSFYGLNAGVLAESGGTVKISGGSVTTRGTGANGVFAYGSKSSISLSNTTIKTVTNESDGDAHGAMASGGGSITLRNVNISTKGAHSSDVATDRGGGTVTVVGGTMTADGDGSPGIYSTGKITATDATFTAAKSEGAVVEGSNSVSVRNTKLTGAKNGVMLYQSFSGDAQVGTGAFVMDGGSLTAKGGDAFFIKNTKAVVIVKNGAVVRQSSGNLIDAASKGYATFTADGERLTGDVITDASSTAAVTLKNHSTLTGKINKAALTLDSTSTWVVTADSTLTGLTDTAGISGGKVTNIVGNGHNVYYDSAANSGLGGKTYSLVNGGQLIPK